MLYCFGRSLLCRYRNQIPDSDLVSFQIFTSRCVFDITYFPFDEQTCEMTFVTWGYRASDILLRGPEFGSGTNLDDLITHPVWNVNKVTFSTSKHPRPMIIYQLSLQRKPRYIILNIILPLIVLIILNVCVFILPGVSGEKTSYAITVFLSFVVFSTVVHETLPVNSENICFLSVFITVQIFQSAAITILAITLIRLERRTDPVPAWLDTSLCRRKIGDRHWDTFTAMNDSKRPSCVNGNTVQPLQETCTDNNANSKTDDSRGYTVKTCETTTDWEAVVHRLDWLLFAVFLITNVVFTTVFFSIISVID